MFQWRQVIIWLIAMFDFNFRQKNELPKYGFRYVLYGQDMFGH